MAEDWAYELCICRNCRRMTRVPVEDRDHLELHSCSYIDPVTDEACSGPLRLMSRQEQVVEALKWGAMFFSRTQRKE